MLRLILPVLVVACSLPLPAAAFDQSHALFAGVLQAHVRAGRVDYAVLLAARAPLDGYVSALGSVTRDEFSKWTREQQFAYWLNAYNAFTLRAIIDRYPIRGSWFSLYPRNSIRQIDGVWDELAFKTAEGDLTLGHLEHEILRKHFVDPRLHAAINCASLSCPELRAEPYLAGKLEAQLEEAARAFAASAARNQVDLPSKTLRASEIFKWFPEDFLAAYAPGGTFGGLDGKPAAAAAFLARFSPRPVGEAIRAGGFTVKFISYDWTLNDVTR